MDQYQSEANRSASAWAFCTKRLLTSSPAAIHHDCAGLHILKYQIVHRILSTLAVQTRTHTIHQPAQPTPKTKRPLPRSAHSCPTNISLLIAILTYLRNVCVCYNMSSILGMMYVICFETCPGVDRFLTLALIQTKWNRPTAPHKQLISPQTHITQQHWVGRCPCCTIHHQTLRSLQRGHAIQINLQQNAGFAMIGIRT